MPSFIEISGLVALAAPASYLLFTSDIATDLKSQLLFSAAVSICAFATTVVAVPALAEYFSRKGLKGRDLGRRGTPQEKDEMYVKRLIVILNTPACTPTSTRTPTKHRAINLIVSSAAHPPWDCCVELFTWCLSSERSYTMPKAMP